MLRRLGLWLAVAATAIAAAFAPAKAEVLKIWGAEQITDPLIADLWNGLKADFEKANPGVTVEFMVPTGTISNGAVQAAIQSDAGPDLVLTNSGVGRVGIVAKAGLVVPLTRYYDERGWKAQLYPWLYDTLKGQFGGEIYEIPDGLDVIGVFYHKDMFAEHGWTMPDSYDGFLKLLGEIKKAGIQPLTVGPRNNANGGHLFGNLLQVTAGRQVVGEVLSGKRPWTDPAMVKGAQRLVDLVAADYVQPQMVGLDLDAAARLWFTKRAAMMVAGPWFTNNARKAGFDMANAGYATMPSDIAGESLATGGVGWSWMLPKTSRHPDLALKWLDYILSDAVMTRRASHASSWMVYPRALSGLTPTQPVLASVFAAADKGVGYNPSVYMPGNVLEAYLQVIQGLIGGQIGAEAGMAQIDGQMQQAAK
ncbi:MAG: ABC transporter substrate-binding protein [Inquilinus sp.]|uniref:ABC transporter substrate-binding protein n=1 Tax=Inquilinus sp. TaxID=1932117 RepID=UPI003F322734